MLEDKMDWNICDMGVEEPTIIKLKLVAIGNACNKMSTIQRNAKKKYLYKRVIFYVHGHIKADQTKHRADCFYQQTQHMFFSVTCIIFLHL